MSLLNKGVRETPETLKRSRRFNEFLKKVLDAAARHDLFHKGSRIVLAVSGGADSVCMLHCLAVLAERMGMHLHVAHYDHGLRGEESRRDAEFVRKLAESLDLPFSCGTGDVKGLAAKRKVSVQEAARMLRYDFLEAVRADSGCDLIATAHTADDQAEEVLSRLIRGSGLQGLAGIPWKRGDTVIRPMLSLYGSEIRAFLQSCSLSFVEDSSNLKRKYLRNRIRLDLIPFLQENFNPAVKNRLNRTAALLSEDMEVLGAIASDAFGACAVNQEKCVDDERMEFSTGALLKFHAAIRRRVFRMALERLGGLDGSITSRHLMGIDCLVRAENPSAGLCLPNGISVRRIYQRLVMSVSCPVRSRRGETSSGPFDLELHGPGRYLLPGRCGEVVLEEVELPDDFPVRKTEFPRPLFLGLENVRFPVRVRSRASGDRFSPLGRGYECRLKKFLINCKVPVAVRDLIPLLVIGDTVIAVGGLEVSDTAAVEPGSRVCLKFSWSGAL